MALITPVTTDGGLSAPNAYLRVSDMQLHRSSASPTGHVMHFCVAFYADAEAVNEGREAICPPRQFINVTYDLDGANPYVQAYDYLKANVWPGAENA